MSEKILAALALLDPKNDNHWTVDNLPRLEAVRLLASDQSLTRAAIEEARPGFLRLGTTAIAVVGAVVAPDPEVKNEAAKTAAGTGVADQEAEQGSEEAGLEEAFERAEARLVASAKRKAASDQEHAQARAEVDVLIEAREKSGASQTLADHLAGYFRGQDMMRQERIARLTALRGISLKDILPGRAPIDQAMGRKTAMGTKRPVRL